MAAAFLPPQPYGVVQVRAAVAQADELADVRTAGRGVAVKPDRARVRPVSLNRYSPCSS